MQNFRALGSLPPDSQDTPPPLQISGYAPVHNVGYYLPKAIVSLLVMCDNVATNLLRILNNKVPVRAAFSLNKQKFW